MESSNPDLEDFESESINHIDYMVDSTPDIDNIQIG